MNVKLPIDDAWEVAQRHLDQDDMIGSTTIQLSNYNIGVHANYVLIARNGLGGKRDIYAAVEYDRDKYGDPQLKEPAERFLLAKCYIGIPVRNAMQAGVVIHVIEDSVKNGIHLVQAVNYIAERWDS